MATMTTEAIGPDDNKPRQTLPCSLHVLCLYFLIFFGVIVTVIVVGIRPVPSPSFTLQDVKLYAFNVSTTNSTVTSNLQVTIFFENTKSIHHTTSFHFDHIDVYASYMSQRITLPTMIPATYIHESDEKVWSLYLNGTAVSVTPYRAVYLAQDEIAGMTLINIEVTGRLRSKFIHVWYENRLKVKCPAYVMFGNKINDGNNVVGWAVNSSFVDNWCYVEV